MIEMSTMSLARALANLKLRVDLILLKRLTRVSDIVDNSEVPIVRRISTAKKSSDTATPAAPPSQRQLRYRLEQMARRWRYTSTELAEVLQLARQDPDRWSAAIELDEAREAEFRVSGVLR